LALEFGMRIDVPKHGGGQDGKADHYYSADDGRQR
jgi:hypothetical protein